MSSRGCCCGVFVTVALFLRRRVAGLPAIKPWFQVRSGHPALHPAVIIPTHKQIQLSLSTHLLTTGALLKSDLIPDHFSGLNQVPVFVDVAFDHQVVVCVVGRRKVGDDPAGNAESSGN